MTKRANDLLREIADPDNLRLAFYKAGKGKRYSSQVLAYQQQLEPKLIALREQILTGEVQVGDYRYFKVFDPKERLICASAFSEQVLHHALMNICHAHFEKAQINGSYASRPGKGVHAALRKAAFYTRYNGWFLKLDVRKFFESIHHGVLKMQLRHLFKDYQVLSILEKIVDSYGSLLGAEGQRGLPIGNLTSQYFANHYLASLDHFIKERLQCKAYVRYMDDLVLWHPKKDWLKAAHHAITDFVENKLLCELKPSLLNATFRGLPFIGYLVFPHHIWLTQRSKRRFIHKMEHLDEMYHAGTWDEATCQRHVLPLVAFTCHSDALDFRKNVITKIAIA